MVALFLCVVLLSPGLGAQMLAKEHFCPPLVVRYISMFYKHLRRLLLPFITFWSAQPASLFIDYVRAEDQSVEFWPSSRWCRLRLVVFPHSATLLPDTVTAACLSVFCRLFLHTDSEVCRETQPQLGGEGQPSPRHTGMAEEFYFLYKYYILYHLRLDHEAQRMHQ